jgi:hypothetical protein
MGRIENPDLKDYGASLGWHGTSSIRAKWRSLSSARASTLKKDLTQSGIVREAIYHQPTNHRCNQYVFRGDKVASPYCTDEIAHSEKEKQCAYWKVGEARR